MPLRTTDFTNTERFTDGDDWIELRVGGLSKGESDQISDLTRAFKIDPAAMIDPAGVAQKIEIDQKVAEANRALFTILCTAWSLEKPINGESYSTLDEASGQWVDEQIGKVLQMRRERAEGKPRSSAKPKRRGGSSARAAS